MYSYKKCQKIDCKVSPYSANFKFLFLKNNLFLPIKNNSNCDSSFFIYIIICIRCNSFYIGEYGRLVKDRLKEHLYCIKTFIPYVKFNSVSKHFNLKGYNYSEDFKFLILNTNLLNMDERKHIERKLILLLKNFDIKIMNEDFSSVYNNLYSIKC